MGALTRFGASDVTNHPHETRSRMCLKISYLLRLSVSDTRFVEGRVRNAKIHEAGLRLFEFKILPLARACF